MGAVGSGIPEARSSENATGKETVTYDLSNADVISTDSQRLQLPNKYLDLQSMQKSWRVGLFSSFGTIILHTFGVQV